nr:paired mesoderm homeobox protein 2-like [Peromyscus maniculatus bairdii]
MSTINSIQGMEPQDITHLLHLGIDEVEEERNDQYMVGPGASEWITLQNVKGSQEKEGDQGGLVLGAAAAGEGTKEEVRDEVPVGSAALVDGKPSSNSQDKGQGEEQIPGRTNGHQLLPGPPGRLHRLRHRFTEFQLQKLERVFERNHYPSAEARKELARWIGVTESRVQVSN